MINRKRIILVSLYSVHLEKAIQSNQKDILKLTLKLTRAFRPRPQLALGKDEVYGIYYQWYNIMKRKI